MNMHKRLLAQITAALLANPFWSNFISGQLYQGKLKGLCVPFLNCYSCPGAVGSCPLGALQNLLAAPYTRFPFYVFGVMILAGGLAGRWVCGWLCPFGLVQELMGRLSRIKKSIPRWLGGAKYLVLVLLVVLPVLWVDSRGFGSPYFCQYLCPQGTLTAGIPLVAADTASYLPLIGWLFWIKVLILAAFLLGSIFIFRPFCRTLCPLGAFYGLFNRFSLFRLHHEPSTCHYCRKCTRSCPLNLQLPDERNSRECIRCLNCRDACPTGSLPFHAIDG